MTASLSDPMQCLGYLTFADLSRHGVVGGYLLVNQHARPIEFHCSAPLRPNRAQEILYGPTLRPFLYAERIAKTLVEQSQQIPRVILTDEILALGLRALMDVPLVLLRGEEETANQVPSQSVATVPFCIEELRLETPAGFETDQSLITTRLTQLVRGWDIAEPLDRIREAIQEAQRTAA